MGKRRKDTLIRVSSSFKSLLQWRSARILLAVLAKLLREKAHMPIVLLTMQLPKLYIMKPWTFRSPLVLSGVGAHAHGQSVCGNCKHLWVAKSRHELLHQGMRRWDPHIYGAHGPMLKCCCVWPGWLGSMAPLNNRLFE